MRREISITASYSERPNKIVIASSEATRHSNEIDNHFVRNDTRFNVNLFKAFTID